MRIQVQCGMYAGISIYVLCVPLRNSHNIVVQRHNNSAGRPQLFIFARRISIKEYLPFASDYLSLPYSEHLFCFGRLDVLIKHRTKEHA